MKIIRIGLFCGSLGFSAHFFGAAKMPRYKISHSAAQNSGLRSTALCKQTIVGLLVLGAIYRWCFSVQCRKSERVIGCFPELAENRNVRKGLGSSLWCQDRVYRCDDRIYGKTKRLHGSGNGRHNQTGRAASAYSTIASASLSRRKACSLFVTILILFTVLNRPACI